MKTVVAFAACLATLMLHLGTVRSECCYPVVTKASNVQFLFLNFRVVDERACCDGTVGTANCGLGTCNIFGCDCSGGCRTGPLCTTRTKRSAQDASQAMSLFDSNNDGQISLEEARASALASTEEVERNFESLDLNQDGFISVYEMDP